MKHYFYIIVALFGLIGTATAQTYDQEFNIADGAVNITTAGTYHIYSLAPATVKANAITIASGIGITTPVNITLENVNIAASGSAFLINAGDSVNLTLVGTNKLVGNGGCGIQTNGSLLIAGNGSLDVTGGGNAGAGIGQLGNTPMGNITISGGTITAKSTTEAAGIGGGNSGAVGTITISGGIITATGGYYSAGIGGAIYCTGGRVIIAGGTITSKAGSYNNNNAIGTGSNHSGMTTTINGGSIKSLNTSGVVNATLKPVATNTAGTALALFSYTVSGITAVTNIYSGNIGSIVLGTDYGITDVKTDATGNLYFYLPAQDPGVTVNISTVLTGVNTPTSSLVKAYAVSRNIVLENAANRNVNVFDISGRLMVSKRVIDDYQTIELSQKGFYIVKVEKDTFKVVVK